MKSLEPLEKFVDPVTAAEFLAVKPRFLLDLARAGVLPAYPLGLGRSKQWRFRLSELSSVVLKTKNRRR